MPTILNAKHQPDQRAHMAIQLDYPLPLKGELKLMDVIASESLGHFYPPPCMLYTSFDQEELSVIVLHFNWKIEI